MDSMDHELAYPQLVLAEGPPSQHVHYRRRAHGNRT